MAYVEVWKEGKLITRRHVNEERAQKGCRIRLGSAGQVRVKTGETKTVGKFEVRMFEGDLPSPDTFVGTTGSEVAEEASYFPEIEGYKVIGRLGEGGMGTVWRAVQLSTHREVALKLLSERRFESRKSRLRFEREVELTARLVHPNIARLYDSGLYRGVYYYAMELIDGVHLDRYVSEQNLSQRQVLELMWTVCQAVHHAHQRGVIHRDLKPSNILVSKDSQPHVLDFGLAKTFLKDDSDVTVSIEGEVAGTLAYMSPEQAMGRKEQMDTRTDVYSLGIILYRFLTGEPPHELSGIRFEVIRRIVEEEVRRPRAISRDIDSDLEALLLKALARDPDDRYLSAGEMADDINNYLSGEPLMAKATTAVYFLRKKIRKCRKPIMVSILGLSLLAAIIVFGYIYVEGVKKSLRKELASRIANPPSDSAAGRENIAARAPQPIPEETKAAGGMRNLEKQRWNPRRAAAPAAIQVDGKPFFVICARSAVPEEFGEYKNVGFNTVYTHIPSNPALDEAWKYGLYVIHNFADYKCKEGLFLPEFWQEVERQTNRWNNHPALLGWMQSTVMLYNKMNPSDIQRLYNLLYAKNPKKSRLLLYGFNENNWKQLYRYNAYTDVVVLENWGILEDIHAAALWYEHALELAKRRPMWYIVPANSTLWENLPLPLAQFRSIAYLGINHGATGILIDGFQYRLWKEWTVGRVDVPGLADPRLADLRKEALRLAGELKELSPAILAGAVLNEVQVSQGNGLLDVKSYADGDKLYIVAVNTSGKSIQRSFYVPKVMESKIDLLGEAQSVSHREGNFTDGFAPYETHLYILRASGSTSPSLPAPADVISAGPFSASWESLEKYTVPQWYRDAKFGIFIHWGVYSVPAFGNEWYPRNMYRAGSNEFKHHIATYGPHNKFGYKDFIPMFKAEKFDPNHWAEVFKKAGAKFVVPVAEHHDGFAMYDCSFSDWCAAKMGPKRDVVGELASAVRKQGLILGLSSHRAEHWWFFNVGMNFDSDVKDPNYAGLYGPAQPEKASTPNKQFLDDWFARTCELVDKYQPQLVWFDGWIEQPVFAPYLQKFAAYYYNRGSQWKKGVAINYKHNSFPEEAAVLDIERDQLAGIRTLFWQTDTSISKNSWGYVTQQNYKTADSIIDDLIDIVSKNGALLLNIGPKSDGTIPDAEEKILLEIGQWLDINGEAIFGTRLWLRSSGTTSEKIEVRFTRKGDSVYAILLDKPKGSQVIIQSLSADRSSTIQMLVTGGNLRWSQQGKDLAVVLPENFPGEYAWTLKITPEPHVAE